MSSDVQDSLLSRFFAVPGEDTEVQPIADEPEEWLQRIIELHATTAAPAFGRSADPAGYKPLTTFKEDTFHKHDDLFNESVKDAGVQAHLREMAAEQPAYQQKLPWAGGAEQEDSFWAFAARSEATSDLFGVLRNRFISVNAPAYQQLQVPLSLPQLPYATWPLTASDELNIVARAAQHPQIRPVPPPPLHTDDDAYSYKAASSQYRGEQQYQAVTAPASPALIDSAAVIFGLPDAAQQQQQQQPLLPLAWERPEARHWRSQPPPLPRLLQSFPRVTQEGGTALFSTVYSDGFAAAAPEHSSQQSSTAQLVQDALAALQGIGSASFVYSSTSQTMLPARLPPQPAHALSRGAARSLLTEIAAAGTHFCRLEAVAAQCSSGAAGLVQRAFGEALQRQLVLLQAAVQALQNGAVHPPEPPPPTLLQLVLKSEPLRRLLACLAEVCKCSDSASSSGSSSGSANCGAAALPRGAALLSYLHQCVCSLDSSVGMGLSAVTSSSSKSSTSDSCSAAAVGLHRRKAVLALLRAACAPWLAMLSKWLWSGDLLEAHDPYHEFPISCKGSTSSSNSSSSDGSGLASWMTEDGGAAFMQHGFTYSSSSSSSNSSRSSSAVVAPAFLSPAVLARALSAGKALRMLLLASSDFHTAARATHPPPLGLVFSSSALTARRSVLKRLQRMQGAAAAALAAELRARRARTSSAAAAAKRARGAGAAEERRAVLAAEAEWRRAKVAVLQQRREWAQVSATT
jgi:Gamma tubulin complex component N-terminal